MPNPNPLNRCTVARLEELKQTEKSIPIEIHARSKNSEKDRTFFEIIINIIKSTEEVQFTGLIVTNANFVSKFYFIF